MEANIKAIHFDISEKLVAFVNKKIEKLTRRFECITEADVNLRLIKPETALNKEAGIKLTVPGTPDLFASKTIRVETRQLRPKRLTVETARRPSSRFAD